MPKRDVLLDALNLEWANRDWTGDGEPYQPASPVMPSSREGSIDLTRSGREGSIDTLALYRVLRGRRAA
jgi:hypothetical protein